MSDETRDAIRKWWRKRSDHQVGNLPKSDWDELDALIRADERARLFGPARVLDGFPAPSRDGGAPEASEKAQKLVKAIWQMTLAQDVLGVTEVSIAEEAVLAYIAELEAARSPASVSGVAVSEATLAILDQIEEDFAKSSDYERVDAIREVRAALSAPRGEARPDLTLVGSAEHFDKEIREAAQSVAEGWNAIQPSEEAVARAQEPLTADADAETIRARFNELLANIEAHYPEQGIWDEGVVATYLVYETREAMRAAPRGTPAGEPLIPEPQPEKR